MAGEAIHATATQVTLTTAGDVVANDAYSTLVVALAKSAVGSMPQANFVLKAGFSTTIGAGKTVELYRRDINVVSTDEGPAPTASYPFKYVGNFPLKSGVSTADEYPSDGPVPLCETGDSEFYLKNGSGVSLASDWALYASPWSLVTNT